MNCVLDDIKELLLIRIEVILWLLKKTSVFNLVLRYTQIFRDEITAHIKIRLKYFSKKEIIDYFLKYGKKLIKLGDRYTRGHCTFYF